MKYRDDFDFALSSLSFSVKAGMKVGVVGRTGAGKSSIMHCLFRLTELYAGAIYIDDQDISEFDLSDLRRQISVI
jgi:ABC-type multidrug transport system fused ATPase/permease subunit